MFHWWRYNIIIYGRDKKKKNSHLLGSVMVSEGQLGQLGSVRVS